MLIYPSGCPHDASPMCFCEKTVYDCLYPTNREDHVQVSDS